MCDDTLSTAEILLTMANRNSEEELLNTANRMDGTQPTTATSASQITQLLAAMTALMQQNTALQQTVSKQQAQTLHYSVLPDLSHNIGEFDGLEGASAAKVWLQQLESTATLHHWTEPIAFETARSRFTKAAKNWFLTNLDTLKNWQAMQPRDVVIGRNFTELPNVSYFKYKDKLVFSDHDKFDFAEFPEIDANNNRKTSNLETVQLPAASINFLNVQIGRENFKLPVENRSDSEITIREGRKVSEMLVIQGTFPKLEKRVEPITENDVTVYGEERVR